jgi:hypothetical protein
LRSSEASKENVSKRFSICLYTLYGAYICKYKKNNPQSKEVQGDFLAKDWGMVSLLILAGYGKKSAVQITYNESTKDFLFLSSYI